MLLNELDEYIRLMNLAEASSANNAPAPEVRVAILGDHATQRLCKIVEACLLERGYRPLIYEGSFDAIGIEARSPALQEFQPEFVYLAICVQRVRERFYALHAVDQAQLSEVYASELRELIVALSKPGRTVVINTLALPAERQFGNYSLFTEQSFYTIILKLNALLLEVARQSGALLNDVMHLASQVGTDHFFDDRFWTISRLMCRNQFLPRLAASLADQIATVGGKVIKCIVLDLDNTLWGGEIGDDGLEGICLGESGAGEAFLRFQQYLLCLRNRGLLLAVCSKNEQETARLPFREHPCMVLKEEHISIFLANWKSKAENIEQIAKVLNIGLDSLLVLDDSPFERGQIRSRLADVRVPDLPADILEWIPFLENKNYFEVIALSSVDQNRGLLYEQEAERGAEFLRYDDI
ncbi:HAD-IIIC family phosphatase, partial [bacterium CPR1]|nr:HAD-IIIC family phosphatase [bacterium CPR1]